VPGRSDADGLTGHQDSGNRSLDFGCSKDSPSDGDTGESIGVAGTPSFAGFRGYDLDQGDGPNAIYVGTFGTRISF
jgi:hypothetical protein